MRCFYHHEKEAVGTCKSCDKGVCLECAVDLGKGLACRGRCEENARAIIELIENNIRITTSQTQVQLAVPPVLQFTGSPIDHVTTQLTNHIRETRNLRRMLGSFLIIIGIVLLGAGISTQLMALDLIGVFSMAFGIVCLVQAQRNAARPSYSETQTL